MRSSNPPKFTCLILVLIVARATLITFFYSANPDYSPERRTNRVLGRTISQQRHSSLSITRRTRAARGPSRLSHERRSSGAKVKCTSSTTFSLCGGDDCTAMGNVADGTVCENDAIVAENAGGVISVASQAANNTSLL